MSQTTPSQPEVTLNKTAEYRSNYSNSVQLKMSQWDLEIIFGTIEQNTPERVELHNFQGIYLSPQQAKALSNLLNQNLAHYEQIFGKIPLEPLVQGQPLPPIPPPGGPVN